MQRVMVMLPGLLQAGAEHLPGQRGTAPADAPALLVAFAPAVR